MRAAGAPDPTLVADCSRCAALCCVAPAFAPSADFALHKAAGRPCPKLDMELRCSIHDSLRGEGFAGCASFDCFGAGQRVTGQVVGGGDWRTSPELAAPLFEAFSVMLALHQVLWHLDAAERLQPGPPLAAAVAESRGAIEQLALGGTAALAGMDTRQLRSDVGTLLARVSRSVRAEHGPLPPSRRGEALLGARLRGARLRAVDLSLACLVGADLQGADLRSADLRGVDLRGADLAGADLRDALFLTQPQLDSARGDARTALSPPLRRPGHWPGLASDR